MKYFSEYTYLLSALCFIWSLKGLSSHKEAKFGSIAGILGMVIAICTCIFFDEFHHKWPVFLVIVAGGAVGTIISTKIQMTAIPQLVAGFHSLVGLSAVLVAYSAYLAPEAMGIGMYGSIHTSSLIEMSLGASIGAITFTGSVVAFAKLHGVMSSKPIKFEGQNIATILLFISILCSIVLLINYQSLYALNLLILLSFIIGFVLIIPIGGADMPVVVSMLNSYSGWAAAGIGFTLGSDLLIITGALVGASGAILSYIMCSAMNRSLFNVIFGVLTSPNQALDSKELDERVPNISHPQDAAFTLHNASRIVIVPGYGMAVSQAQHLVKALVDKLKTIGADVKFAIHPVAGRMPGHMNVLLAEANIPYDIVHELEDINHQFSETDVTIVIGANDITNPAAKNDTTSPIYGMPILEVENSKIVYFIKRSMSSGYAGIENDLFFNSNTHMLFGDAKKVVDEIIKSMEG